MGASDHVHDPLEIPCIIGGIHTRSAAPRPGDGRDRHDGERAVVIRAKVGLLELAERLGNVGQACKVLS